MQPWEVVRRVSHLSIETFRAPISFQSEENSRHGSKTCPRSVTKEEECVLCVTISCPFFRDLASPLWEDMSPALEAMVRGLTWHHRAWLEPSGRSDCPFREQSNGNTLAGSTLCFLWRWLCRWGVSEPGETFSFHISVMGRTKARRPPNLASLMPSDLYPISSMSKTQNQHTHQLNHIILISRHKALSLKHNYMYFL